MKPVEIFNNAIAGKGKNNIPVVLWVNAPFLSMYANENSKEYYLNPEVKLNSYLMFQEEFPEIIIAQGISPDFGAIVEPSAFGGEVVWLDKGAPHVKAGITKDKDILSMGSLDPLKSEMMSIMLDEYKYLWNNLDRKYIEEYGYLHNMAYSLGPLETAGLAMGYEKFFTGFFEIPALIHKLLEIITEGIIKWIRAQEKINGKIERLYLPDHVPTQMSPELFVEFGFPYFKQICEEFKDSTIFWHNEGRVNHIVKELKKLPIDVYHFGHDLELLKNELGSDVCLMGNVPPIEVLHDSTPNEIIEDCLKRLEIGGSDGRFFLSTGGGLCPGTSSENFRALIEAAEVYNNRD